MKKIVVLSTDTLHHRYFINKLLQSNIPLAHCFFETKHTVAPFPTGPLFEEQEQAFEIEQFFVDVPKALLTDAISEVESVASKAAIEQLEKIKPDFGIVFGTGKLTRHVIEHFPDGLINVHRGMSALYRGLDSDLWAIYHGDYENVGVTIHKVEEALDTGHAVAIEKMPILPNMKIWQIRYHTTVIATKLVLQAVTDYLRGSLHSVPQATYGRYYSFMPLVLKERVMMKFNKHCEGLVA